MVVRCTVRKHADAIEIDYSGSNREELGGYSARVVRRGLRRHLGLANMLPDAISPNAGESAGDPLTPAGSCMHALPPMSTNAGQRSSSTKAVNLVKAALSRPTPPWRWARTRRHRSDQLRRDRTRVPGSRSSSSTCACCRVPRGEPPRRRLCLHAGGGRQLHRAVRRAGRGDVPAVVLGREFVIDTAGPGRYRGGPATRRSYHPAGWFGGLRPARAVPVPHPGRARRRPGSQAFITIGRGALQAWAAGEGLPDATVIAGVADVATARGPRQRSCPARSSV